MIPRNEYLDRLIGFRDKQVIKVVTGIRRCGKSTILRMFAEYLRNDGVGDDRIISVNFEDPDNSDLLDWRSLYDHIKSRSSENGTVYVFLDEIQAVPGYEKAVNGLLTKNGFDIYITGSNAFMLSGELATLLSGRYVEIPMLPLSFKEYVSVTQGSDLDAEYVRYIRGSSFPYALELSGNRDALEDYLSGIYSTVVLKDIMARGEIKNQMVLESIIRFMFDNIGNLVSSTNVANALTSGGRKTSVQTVEKYLSLMTDSFLFYRAGRYDVKGKQHLRTGSKYYAADIGLRYHLLGTGNADMGRILENVVYLELLRRGYRVSVGKIGDAEVDFVATDRRGMTEYYQVAYTAKEVDTLEREIRPLMRINDHNGKYLLAADREPVTTYDGIRKVNVFEWLLGRE